MKNSSVNFFDKIAEGFNRIRLFLYLFQQQKIHRYFLVLVLLMFISAFLFFIIEYDNIISATEPIPSTSVLSRAITVLYWSVVTISTTGYGDILPQTDGGRVLVIAILFLGIVTVSLFTANLASATTTKKILEGRGIMNLAKVKGHYVICGWKKQMGKFFEDILKSNPEIVLRKITVIANVEPDEIELFRQNYPQFAEISILRGDHYNETLLRKSNVQNAAKVLILADESHPESIAGVDSLTVLTAMTVRAISVNVAISAELIDIKFEKHLKNIHVDEIIYTNEYSSSLMATSLQFIGLTKIINDLLIQHGTAYLSTEKIPKEFVEQEYRLLKDHYFRQDNALLIGLLENVGSFLERKKEAIRAAQKTADVKTLVDNLKTAKNLENNQSNILPKDSYIVPGNSLAIVIRKENS